MYHSLRSGTWHATLAETLQAAAGFQAEECLRDTITKHRGEYLMLVEGSVPLAEDGCYCVVGGR